MPSVVVYNLSYNEVLLAYLPSVIIANVDKLGKLRYMEKKGTPEVVQSYALSKEDGLDRYALELCQELEMSALKKYFVKSKKLTLAKAIENKSVLKSVMRAVNRMIDKFLLYIIEHDLPICIDVERGVYLEDLRLQYSHETLVPELQFVKSKEGIDYTLVIKNKKENWYPFERDIKVICDKPGWVLDGKILYKLDHINANKLKPFINKKKVHIPDRIAKDYLEKFVKDIISKVSVKTEGFQIHEYLNKPTASLQARFDFIKEVWILELIYHYGQDTFHYRSMTRSRTRLQYSEDEEVGFYVVRRQDDAESKYLSKLEKSSLSIDNDGYINYQINDADPYEIIFWMQKNFLAFSDNGIEVIIPTIDDKTLNTSQPQMRINTTEDNDWFDIAGIIVIGDHQISFRDLIQNIKEENRIYSLPDNTCFIIPIEWMNKYKGLARWAKEKGDGVKILRSQFGLLEDQDNSEDDSMRIYDYVKEGAVFAPSINLKATLRPYQIDGAAWLVSHQDARLGCCLADDMGLGKTLQTICALLYAKESTDDEIEETKSTQEGQMSLFDSIPPRSHNFLRSLIIMPSSLIFNWQNELNKFSPHLRVKKHIGPNRTKKNNDLSDVDVVITSYGIVLRDVELLKEVAWSYIVLDESQYIKNHQSKIFAAIQQLPSDYKLSLSGTPIENSLSDLWSQMQFINPDILGTYSFFKKHFQVPIERHEDEHMLEELRTLIKPYILRRTKEQVLMDLPEKSEQLVYCDMTAEQKSLYEKEKSAARNLIIQSDASDPQTRIRIITALLRLRQLANHPSLYKKDYQYRSGKYEILKETMWTIVKAGHKALVFSTFVGHLDLITAYLQEEKLPFVSITGSTSQRQREEAVTRFQKDKDLPFFLISIKAGGTGLNLTAADYILILDPWWNPFVENQAIARAHRIGLDHPLTVLRYISTDTIEEKIIKLQEKKRQLSEDILSPNEAPRWTNEELDYLLK